MASTPTGGDNPIIVLLSGVIVAGVILKGLSAAPIVGWLVAHHILLAAAPIPLPGMGGAGVDFARIVLAMAVLGAAGILAALGRREKQP
ncbi:MAG: hypothetical protein WAX29_03970 [Propionibacterium sp.]